MKSLPQSYRWKKCCTQSDAIGQGQLVMAWLEQARSVAFGIHWRIRVLFRHQFVWVMGWVLPFGYYLIPLRLQERHIQSAVENYPPHPLQPEFHFEIFQTPNCCCLIEILDSQKLMYTSGVNSNKWNP